MEYMYLTIGWENSNRVQLTSKLGKDGDLKYVAYHQEDGKIAELWAGFEKICLAYLKEELKDIGEVMKS